MQYPKLLRIPVHTVILKIGKTVKQTSTHFVNKDKRYASNECVNHFQKQQQPNQISIGNNFKIILFDLCCVAYSIYQQNKTNLLEYSFQLIFYSYSYICTYTSIEIIFHR